MEASVTPEPAAPRWTLWVGLWGGAAAWTVHLLACYGIAEFGCVSGLGRRALLGLSVVAWMILTATAVTLLLAAASTWAAWRSRRPALRRERSPAGAAAPGQDPLARSGVWTSGLFTGFILVQSVPIFFYLGEC